MTVILPPIAGRPHGGSPQTFSAGCSMCAVDTLAQR